MQVKSVPIEKLQFDPSNANTHDQKNLDAIKGSLSLFGQVEALIVNKRNHIVVGGNGRLQVMKQLGWKNVNVYYMDLTPSQHAALSIALNRSGELSKRDPDKLAKTLLALRDEDFQLDAIGFDELDMSKLLNEKLPSEDDEAPTPKEEWLVVVECDDERQQSEVFEHLQAEGLKCKIM